ncbi:PTS lactose/cellobiose transporter subunit IIA [Fonticella tunisiensis]|uniref:PTS system cellobiose-specific IIA component n=1 Tax=Fonticella tunisiensis TaxID=1096341 RepID=A0A4R7KRW8_9CLOT|nr:PTS lactose/cellobiose transporter subunit IIA [Fonticella tunisiensis]TDT62306.1 PTS system cellobiose-specific IIA component [Fonticella tunisiensis]
MQSNNIRKIKETNVDRIAMGIIANAGDSRSLSFEALQAAREGNFEEAKMKLKESSEKLIKAHEFQTQLMIREAEGEEVKSSVLISHAQDHLMIAILARDLIEEMIALYER